MDTSTETPGQQDQNLVSSNRVVRNDCESNNKRPLSDSDSGDELKHRRLEMTDKTTENTFSPVPLFLIVKHAEDGQSLSKVSPFLVNKALSSVGGPPTSIKKLRNGTILVEAKDCWQAKNLLKMTSFYDKFPVSVEPHGTLNSSKGVVFSRELLDCSTEEIQTELQECGVVEVVRITRMDGGSAVPTPGLILTFSLPHPPTCIKAGYLSLSVRPYFRNPQRCFKCQKFGHSSRSCTNEDICVQCGAKDHNEKTCTNNPSCANCHGKHPASSRDCSVYLEEREVIKISTVDKLPFIEARKEYRRRQAPLPRQNVSYSQAAQTVVPVASSECSRCNSLEATVLLLTEQMAKVISLLTNSVAKQPESLQKQIPEKPLTKEQPSATKGLYLKKDQPKANFVVKPRVHQNSAEIRKTLSDKLKQNLISKSAKKTGNPSVNPNSSNRSSLSSLVEEDMISDELGEQTEFRTVTGKFKTKQGRTKITIP